MVFSCSVWDDFFDQLDEIPHRPSGFDFFRRKSTSTVHCPILACRSSRWRSKSSVSTGTRPAPKTLLAPVAMAFFQSATSIGWMSKFLGISSMVWTPLSASSARQAVHSGSCLLRLAFPLCG